MLAGESEQFTASVSGLFDQSINWTLEGGAASNTVFRENFTWQGGHAAVVNEGKGTTVWWDEDNWDTYVGSAHNTVDALGEGNAIDISRSPDDLSDGSMLDDRFVIGGDGSPGVGVMRLDFEGIISARLRNPMLISESEPGVVEFMAPSFATTGHWWEVAIAPTDSVIGGDFTSVPGPGSVEHTFFQNPGPGNAPAEESINFIFMGSTDIPCEDGWQTITGFTRTENYDRTDVEGPEIPNNPDDKNSLYRFRIVYYPEYIEVYTDINENGQMDLLHTYPVNVPWDEVYVILLGIGYQADHHPQNDECFQGQKRDLQWKDLSIGPVKYASTSAFPKQGGVDQVARNTGWMQFDLRDTLRFGEVNGATQPNPERYDKNESLLVCTDAENVFGCETAVTNSNLEFDLPANDAEGISKALFTYNIRRTGGVTLYVNDSLIGELPRADLPSLSTEEWIHRSIDVPVELFTAGTNSVRLVYEGDVQLEDLQMEFLYGTAGESTFAGRISSDGLYVAPEHIEEDFEVTVRATSVEDPSVTTTQTIMVRRQNN